MYSGIFSHGRFSSTNGAPVRCNGAARFDPSDFEPDPPARKGLERLTSAELFATDFKQDYIIPGILPERQGGCIAARYKCLKTTIGVDLMFSVATGTPFLGRFKVSRPRRAGVISAESGHAALREIGCRVARSRGENLADATGLVWSTTLPCLSDNRGLDDLESFIIGDSLAALFVDPTYLAFPDAADTSASVYGMGKLLLRITDLVRRTGCSIILCHHCRKERAKGQEFTPPSLSEITGSGFAEWARFWLLLAHRREWCPDTGRHWLWMASGGSAGHAALSALDVLEGKQTDTGGRQWTVQVLTPSEAQNAAVAERAANRASKTQQQRQRDDAAVLEALEAFPTGATKRDIQTATNLNNTRLSAALELLTAAGAVEALEFTKGKRTYTGFRRITPSEQAQCDTATECD